MVAFLVDNDDSPRATALWRCDGCGCVHVRTKESLLTFTAAEFAAYTATVNDCYWRGALTGSLADQGRDSDPCRRLVGKRAAAFPPYTILR
jgi:hypothetical protein